MAGVQLSVAQEKALLEQMRAALRTRPEGLTCAEMMAAVGGLTIDRCRRLLTILIGKRFATRNYELRSTQPNGLPRKFLVYRSRET
jgi:hypothetical protein